MKRDNREYRNFQILTRAENQNGSYLVEGYATTFDEYVLFEDEGIQYKERILPEAFENCDMSDVIFVKDHEGTVYARTKNKTLTLEMDERGLKSIADLSKTSAAREMFEEIKTGMYSQMSFAFIVDDDEYNSTEHLRTIRHIKKIYDVSAVSFPANPETEISIATRNRFDGFIEEERAERLKREEELAVLKAKFIFEKEKNNGN